MKLSAAFCIVPACLESADSDWSQGSQWPTVMSVLTRAQWWTRLEEKLRGWRRSRVTECSLAVEGLLLIRKDLLWNSCYALATLIQFLFINNLPCGVIKSPFLWRCVMFVRTSRRFSPWHHNSGSNCIRFCALIILVTCPLCFAFSKACGYEAI